MKIILTLLLLIPSLSWGVKFESIWDGRVSDDFQLSLQVYSGPESDDKLLLVIWPPSITGVDFINVAGYQFTEGELDIEYQGEEDFTCLKSIFEKAVEWADIAKINSIKNIEKEIDKQCTYRLVTLPPEGAIYSFRFETTYNDFDSFQDSELHITFFWSGELFELVVDEKEFREMLKVFNNLENHFQDISNKNLKMEKDLELFQ